MIKLVRGKAYPLPVPKKEGASANFLIKSGNALQILLPGMTSKECIALRSGKMKVGFLYKKGSLLWLIQFYDR